MVAEAAGFVIGEMDDSPVFRRCEVICFHNGFLLALLFGIELAEGREGLEIGGFYETEIMGFLTIAVVHQYPTVFPYTLPNVGGFASGGFRVDEGFLISPGTSNVVTISLFDARCSLMAYVGEIITVTHFDDIAIDG